MRLSDLHPDEVEQVSKPEEPSLKLSDLHPDDVQKVNSTPPSYSKLLSSIRGGIQGATGDFSDEVMGAIHAPMGALKTAGNLVYGKDVTDDQDVADYTQARDQERAENALAEKSNPKSYLAGKLVGGFGTALVPGLGEMTLPKSIALGAGTALGSSEADLSKGETGQAVKDATLGAGMGYIGHHIGEALGGLLGKTSKSLQKDAGDTALGAIGANQAAVRAELGQGQGLLSGAEFRKGVGQEALQNLNFTGGAEGIRAQVQDKLLHVINQKNEILASANDILMQKVNNGELPAGIATPLEDSLKNLVNNKIVGMESTEMNANTIRNLRDMAMQFVDRIKGNDLDIEALDKLKQGIGAELSNRPFNVDNRELANQDLLLKDIYGAIKGRIEELADFVGNQTGQDIKALNIQEGNLLDLNKIALTSAAKEITGKSGALGNITAYGAGSFLGGPLGGLLAVGTKQGVEKATGFGLGNLGRIAGAKSEVGAAKIADWMSKNATPGVVSSAANIPKEVQDKDYMTKLGATLYTAPNEALHFVADKLNQAGYSAQGEALTKALESNNDISKNAILFTIMQDPNKRALLHSETIK